MGEASFLRWIWGEGQVSNCRNNGWGSLKNVGTFQKEGGDCELNKRYYEGKPNGLRFSGGAFVYSENIEDWVRELGLRRGKRGGGGETIP